MSAENREARRRQLIRDVLTGILDDPEFRRWVREIVLVMTAEAEELRTRGYVTSFLQECEARGVKLRIDGDGKLLVRGADRLGADLRAFLTLHRPRVFAALARERDDGRPTLRTKAV